MYLFRQWLLFASILPSGLSHEMPRSSPASSRKIGPALRLDVAYLDKLGHFLQLFLKYFVAKIRKSTCSLDCTVLHWNSCKFCAMQYLREVQCSEVQSRDYVRSSLGLNLKDKIFQEQLKTSTQSMRILTAQWPGLAPQHSQPPFCCLVL